MSQSDNAPILVGVGQQTWRDNNPNRTPTDALEIAARAALDDAGSAQLASAIDALGMIRFIADANPDTRGLFPRNPGAEVAQRLGLSSPEIYQATIGGNTPQYMVNHFAAKLQRGEHRAVLLSGAELLATMFGALGSGADISAWPGEPAQEPPTIGQERDGLNATESAHGLFEPINTYPLFENRLAHELGLSSTEHQQLIAELSANMSAVAASNPYAWRQDGMSAEQIGTVEKSNRYVGYPYTRVMNAVLAVDMAAAVVMTTVGQARELGIDPDRWVYLCGGADVNDVWYPSERQDLHRSPAVELAWQTISQQTGVNIDAVDHFDIYSCFPSAVQVACREIGLDPLDARGVTVTGGLPFFGGPGNNYSLHAIAQMVERLRERGGRGLVTANGMYLTKHSMGLYAAEAPDTPFQPTDNAALQAQIDAAPLVPLAQDPAGPATVETYTVAFGREGPKKGIVIARNDAGERILANTAEDPELLAQMVAENPIGKRGTVTVHEGKNLIQF